MNNITHIQIKTIIPLEYDREKFLESLNDENGVFSEQSIYEKVEFDSIYNELGKKLFISGDKQVYLARIKEDKYAGLYQNNGATYFITNMKLNTTNIKINKENPLKFEMDDIYIYFHRFRAYLVLTANIPVVQWIENGVEAAEAADLYSQCRDYFTKNLSRSGERTFYYKTEEESHDYSYKAVAKNICGKIGMMIGEVKLDLEHIYSQCNVLLKMVPEDDNETNNLIQDFIFSGNAGGSINNPSNGYLSGNWQKSKNGKINKLFWGYGDKQFVITPNEQFDFTNGPSKNFYRKAINKIYMALYTLWIDSREKLLLEKGDSREAWENIRALFASVLKPDDYGHINDIFISLANAIAQTPQDIAVPMKDMESEDDYIFVSYSHKDFIKVYCDLYHFKDKGLPFWYDRGLYENANEEWHRHVQSRLESPNCKGVLFYLSENFLLSKSVEREVKTVLSSGKPYFVVSLSDNPIPGAVLKKALVKAPLPQVQDNDFMEMVQTMAQAFPNTKTVLNPYDNEYYQQIEANIKNCLP